MAFLSRNRTNYQTLPTSQIALNKISVFLVHLTMMYRSKAIIATTIIKMKIPMMHMQYLLFLYRFLSFFE